MSITKGSFTQVRVAPVYNDIVNGEITQFEFNKKLFDLQCSYKDLAYKITNKWRYGIFCPEDSDKLIELRSLLRLLICYGKETEEILDDSQVPDCYNDYLDFGGHNWNEYIAGGTVVNIGDYFFVTSPTTGNYYILKGVGGYSSAWPLTTSHLNAYVYQLDNGETTLIWGTPSGGWLEYYAAELQCSGLQSDLDNALQAAAGVIVTSSGLSDAEIITIINRIEKLLKC